MGLFHPGAVLEHCVRLVSIVCLRSVRGNCVPGQPSEARCGARGDQRDYHVDHGLPGGANKPQGGVGNDPRQRHEYPLACESNGDGAATPKFFDDVPNDGAEEDVCYADLRPCKTAS